MCHCSVPYFVYFSKLSVIPQTSPDGAECDSPETLRDAREKFIRRFHAFKLAPTLSLGMVDVRRVDRTSRVVDLETKKSSSKQEW